MPSNHLILCRALLLLPSIFPSIRVFSNEADLLIRWPKYQSFSFSISPSDEYSGLISFRMDWLGLLAVHGTLKSFFQHHSSKASILQRSAFFIVQLSHPYVTTCNSATILPFPESHIVGIIQSVAFSDGLLSLSKVHLSFLPVSAWPDSSFLFSFSAALSLCCST